jgi:glycosyltransferase involved in cell wall biosynthesis
MSLRIAWASPWNARSAIAAFSAAVCAELAAEGHRVEIIRTETGEAARLTPLPAPFGPVLAPGALSPELLASDYDAVVVNLGNYYAFHAHAPALLAQAPCVAIVHDVHMEDFAWAWRDASPEPDGLAALRSATPMMPALAALGCAAVVHAPHYRAVVEQACPGPVIELPLAYCPPVPPPPGAIGPDLTVATVGHVNANKRVDQVIRAIGASPRLRARGRYRLLGPVSPEEQERLLRIARAVGAPAPDFTGWIPDDALVAHLAGADAVACLRYPVTEGGSASVVLALRSGRPTLVSDTGVYASLPEGIALRCTPGEEAADVLRHLEWILDNPGAARQLGERAAAWAAETHAPAAYAARLVPFLRDAARGAPAILAARSLGLAAARLGFSADEPALSRTVAALAELVGSEDGARG